jgi:MFS family permease
VTKEAALAPIGASALPSRTHPLGVAAACALGNVFGLSTILYVTFSLFIVPVTTSLGWTRAELSFSLTLISAIDLFAYPLAGLLMDRFGARPVMLVGNLLFGLSIMALSQIGSARLPAYILFALIGLTAALPSTVLISRVLASWFRERRGLAMSVCSGLAFGVGGTLTANITQALLARYDWRTAYLVLGALPILIVLPVMAIFLRDAPADTRDAAVGVAGSDDDLDFRSAVRTRPFVLLFLSAVLASAAIHVVSSHLAVFLQANGMHGAVAAQAISALAITTALWQLVLGYALDKVPSPKAAGLCLIVAGVGALMIFEARSPPLAIVGSLLLGIGSGTEFALMPYCLSRYFGLRHFGIIYGCMFGCVAFAIGLSPFLLDLLYDATGVYQPSVFGCAATLGMCGVFLLSMPPFPRGDAR